MALNAELLIKEEGVYYEVFSKPIKLRCPICRSEAKGKTKRTRTYHSLKSLSWHIARSHSDTARYPFTIEQVKEVLRVIGIAIHWEILL